jgi:hypothetical protein
MKYDQKTKLLLIKRAMMPVGFSKITKVPVLAYASERYNGVKCVVANGRAYSSNLLEIPNNKIQRVFRKYRVVLDYLDGEIVALSELGRKKPIFNRYADVDFVFYVHDFADTGHSIYWTSRYKQLIDMKDEFPEFVVVKDYYKLTESQSKENPLGLPEASLLELKEKFMASGAKSIFVRDAYGKYIQRDCRPSTPYVFDLPFEDVEAASTLIATGTTYLSTT